MAFSLCLVLALIKMKEFELKHISSVTEVFHIQVVEQIQIILSKVIYGGLGSIAVTLEIRRIWIMQYRNSQAVKKFIRCKK